MSNWLDSAISFLSPAAGAKRAKARLVEQTYKDVSGRRFEGATKGGRTGGWVTSSSSSNTANGPALVLLRDRSRDLVRNNPYAARAVQAIPANVVGTGIVAKPIARSEKNANDLAWAWKRWALTTECDADGLLDFYGIQSLAMRAIVESGEVLIRRRQRFVADGLTVPLQIQVLEPDFIDTTKSQVLKDGSYIIQGIEFNRMGRRVAYWLYSEHPGDTGLASKYISFESKRIPAEDILHLFRVDRAGQIRGIAWGAPVIIRLRDFDEYEDAQLVRQKIAACFAGFIQDIKEPDDFDKTKATVGEKIEPGLLEFLPPGKQITFPNPPQVTGYGEFARITLQAVAAGYGVTYELLTNDLSRVNFSSGRMGWIEFNRNIEQWRWQMLIPRLCNPVFRWFLEAAALAGYKGTDEAMAEWTPPAREMIDPGSEISATVTAIRAGLKTLSGAIREQGYDPEEFIQEMIEDNAKIDKGGLILDSDARKTMQAGIAQSYVSKQIEAEIEDEGGSKDAEDSGA